MQQDKTSNFTFFQWNEFGPSAGLTAGLGSVRVKGFDSCDRPSNRTQIGFKIIDFSAPVTLKFDGSPQKTIGHFFYTMSSFVHYFKSILWIQTGFTVRKCSIQVNIGDILSRVTLKIDGWYWKVIGHLFYTTSSFVHHFKSIGEVKHELQSGNNQFGSKLVIFCLTWPWNLMDDLEKHEGTSSILLALSFVHHFKPWVNSNWSYSPEALNSGRNGPFFLSCDHEISRMTLNKANLRDLIAATGLVILLKFDVIHRFLSPCDLEIWCITLENNRAPLLYYIKLCASFHTHWWFQISVTVRKRSIWVKIDDFFSRVTLKFDGWPSKTIGHLFYATSSFVQHFIAIGEFKLELQSGNAQSGSNSTIFRAVWPWNLTDDLQKQ